MSIRLGLARGLRAARRMRGISQDGLGVSSRTYLSALELGKQTPTLDKLDEIARAIGVHPLSVLYYAYAVDLTPQEVHALGRIVCSEIAGLEKYDIASG
ncbi:helix-turn-helix domain-containing protein [Paraburkholderia xenovorans]|uniref:Transcriptional regulator, XRE family n=1 Tax=Paraburkholderia xenovorans (strain LB400) TaxID=266265 RepID=Q13J56_PARXL|nr:helix-turn-helix transcriptional regulator [Paraburkholderia xenovorans]ABE35883.1 transcriptional regulator, XRE family [Paraburkholderia xenovorans LB400]